MINNHSKPGSFSMGKLRIKLALLITLLPFVINAQFGPHNFIFDSEITYCNYIFSGDVDLDGDADVFVQTGSPNGVFMFENLGNGDFADPFNVIPSMFLNYGMVVKIADLDNDSDGDMIVNGGWYRNDGPGVAFVSMGSFAPASIGASGTLYDFDGDGDLDDIGRSATDAVVLLNNGSGTFSVGGTIGVTGSNTTISVRHADLNGDLIEDIVIGGNNTQIGWYPGNGNGTFGSGNTIAQFIAPATPELGDVDNDGDVDLLAFNAAPGSRWWSNNGSGVFTLADTINPDAALPDMIADVDGDGDVDLSMETGSSCNTQIWRNDNGLTWSLQLVEYMGGYSLQHARYGHGDIDSDGDEDLFSCHGMSIAAWFPNNGNGTIGQKRMIANTTSGGRQVSSADVDLDGDQDLVVASYYADCVSLFLNNGNGTFSDQQLIAEHCDKITSASFADLDVDGKPDLITDVKECAILWNNGSSWTKDTLPGQVVARQAMDADGDLDVDLILNGSWLQNDGNGNFTTVIDADIPVIAVIDTADVNGDGFLDFVSGDGDTLSVLLSNGADDFTVVYSPAVCNKIRLADMDGDGDVDAVTSPANTHVYIYLNDGNGNFTGGVQYQHPVGLLNGMLAKDFDADGDVDVIWALSNGYTHQVYMNRNLGPAVLGAAELLDPAAEVTFGMLLSDMNNDAVPDLLFSRFRSLTWRENFYYNAYRLRGSVFKDFNQDAILDPGEQKVPFQLVRTDVNNLLVWTNSAGDYDLAADTGNVQVWTVHPSVYQITNNPDTLDANLTLVQPIQEALNFGMAPYAEDSSAFLSLTTSDFLRCNTNVELWVNVQNIGTFIPEHAVLDVTLHSDLTANAFYPAPDSVTGNHYYFHIDSLGWFQQWGAVISLTTGPVGSGADIHASLTWFDGQTNVFADSIIGLVGCAYDPNDKLVTPQGYGVHGAVDINTDWLTYTVRFQNTGTDTAFTVIIADTLDADLDWASLNIVAASHPLTGIMVDENGCATFRFDQILLPDSNVNEPMSHGFIKYRISPLDNAVDGTQITNTAAIYFDLNAPVITNTVLNTLVNCNLFTATVTSQSGNDTLFATTPGETYQWFLNGDTLTGDTLQWLVTNGAAGSYYVLVMSEFGCVAQSNTIQIIVTGIDESLRTKLTVSPNPSTGEFRLTCNEECNMIEVTDLSGIVMYTYTGSKKTWNVTDKYEPGVYLIRAYKDGRQSGVVRLVIE